MKSNLRTPRDKYMNDPEYNRLVDTLSMMIDKAQFTPSELREACILACIHYELRHAESRKYIIDEDGNRVAQAVNFLERWRHSHDDSDD